MYSYLPTLSYVNIRQQDKCLAVYFTGEPADRWHPVMFDGLTGSQRLERCFEWFRGLQMRSNVPEDQWSPRTLQELGKAYKRLCMTEWEENVSAAIWNGLSIYIEATGKPSPTFKEAVGIYKYVYKHPTEPRFAAIKAEKAWSELISDYDCIYAGEGYDAYLRLSEIIHHIMVSGWQSQLMRLKPSMITFRPWQTANGCLVKTGKILEHLLSEMTPDDRSILAGYVQEQLREGVASTDKVLVSNEVGEIYAMGGNFVSCMRSLNWDYKSTGIDAFQIYKDLGARIAYMVKPETHNGRLVVRDGKTVKKLAARAIIWDEVFWRPKDSLTKTIKIMDTIYRDGADEEATMRKWARQNGYAYKTVGQSYSCLTFTYGPDRADENFDLSEGEAWVTLKNGEAWKQGMYERVPWVDTFCHLEKGGNVAVVTGNHEMICLHNQSGKGGFLTEIRKCCKCKTLLDQNPEEEDDARQDQEGNWWCRSCIDLNWHTCNDCGEEFPEIDMTNVGDHWYCENCADDNVFECYNCGERSESEDEMYIAPDGNRYCEDCYSERYQFCDSCQQDCPSDEVTYYENLDRDICDYCFQNYFSQCEECDGAFERDDVVEVTITNNGKEYDYIETLCNDCFSNSEYVQCPECEDWYDLLDPRAEALGIEMCYSCFRSSYFWCKYANTYCCSRTHRIGDCNDCLNALRYMSE